MPKVKFGEVRLGKEFVADWCPHAYLKINESQGEDVKTGLIRFFDDDSEVEVLP